MKSEQRYLRPWIGEDLEEKMVFVGGPRQVGKTTLALQCLGGKPKRPSHKAYLNWDDLGHRDRILRGQLPSKEPIVILDEIHKFADWRNLVKGFHDRHKGAVAFLVTGSARLDHYRRGGDSLQGRYHYYRLHPFSLPEMGADAGAVGLEQLLRFGGFPEPLLKADTRFHRRWLREQGNRVLTWSCASSATQTRGKWILSSCGTGNRSLRLSARRASARFRHTPAISANARRSRVSIRCISGRRITVPKFQKRGCFPSRDSAGNWKCLERGSLISRLRRLP